MVGLSGFEQAVLDKFLEGDHPVLTVLRAQAETGRLGTRNYSGAGFYLSFEMAHGAPMASVGDFRLGDVVAKVVGLQYGAGFLLFVREGRLAVMEGYSF